VNDRLFFEDLPMSPIQIYLDWYMAWLKGFTPPKAKVIPITTHPKYRKKEAA